MGKNMLVATESSFENRLRNSLILPASTDSHTFLLDLQELNDLNNQDYTRSTNQANQENSFHTVPSLLLHERDLAVLADLLEGEDTPEILANINESLVCLSPEPGWDDFPENLLEVFDFLF